jgi:hypothetical protein
MCEHNRKTAQRDFPSQEQNRERRFFRGHRVSNITQTIAERNQSSESRATFHVACALLFAIYTLETIIVIGLVLA